MVWMAISAKGVSHAYVHRGKQALNQEICLTECINLDEYHLNGNFLFWSDLARSHYSNKNIPYVSRVDKAPQMLQASLSGQYLNGKLMKTIGKQIISIIWFEE